jgi:hypothetical protein
MDVLATTVDTRVDGLLAASFQLGARSERVAKIWAVLPLCGCAACDGLAGVSEVALSGGPHWLEVA